MAESDPTKPCSSNAAAVHVEMPRIFKVNVDCLDKIFDYLSAKDLHSMGKTCRAMQQAAGEYFQLNFGAAEKFLGTNGVKTVYSTHENVHNDRIETPAFNRFTQFLSHYYEELGPLRYVNSHADEFEAVNHLYLVCLQIDSAKAKYLQKLLPKVEIMQIRQCTVRGDLYDILLKHCKNLVRLYIQDDMEAVIHRRENQWLLRNYPTLLHAELSPRYSFRMNELQRFFELNPSISSFTTNSHTIWTNRNAFLEAKLKLNRLEIKHFESDYHFYYEERLDLSSVCEILNELHANGFYKRLHLHINKIGLQRSINLASIRGLDKLSISHLEKCYSLTDLTDLKELSIYNCSNADEMNRLADSLINIERLYLCNVATFEHLLPFVSRSPKLTTIKFSTSSGQNNSGIFNLVHLNKIRMKLADALKVVIYAEDNIFLATKWSTQHGDMNLKFVEMRRASSFRWDYDYSTVRVLH